MNTLPVAMRELRVAARKRSTFWLRVAAAATAFLIGAAFLVITAIQGTSTASVGRGLFSTLSWLGMAAGLCTGLFLTSDCVSLEKREGTLGLLFLTSLRGYDVIAGKLVATSMRGFYALLAVLPVLAITQLMGGIEAAEYWRTALALVNGLLFSLAAGMLISALGRDSQKAMMATLLLLLVLVFGGPIVDGTLSAVRGRPYQPFWSFTSPGFLLAAAGGAGRAGYWMTFITTHSLAWIFLLVSCVAAPRTWQEKGRRLGSGSAFSYAWRYGKGTWRERSRRKQLDRDPISWLLGRELWPVRLLWVFALVLIAGLITAIVWDSRSPAWVVWNYLGGLLALLLYFWAASQACRFFVEARRTGLLELLLASPVDERRIVSGQWRAWRRMFAVPVLLLIAVQVTGVVLSQISFFVLASQAATAPAMTAPASTNQAGVTTARSGVVSISVNASGSPGALKQMDWATKSKIAAAAAVTGTAAAATVISNILGLLWFGMWMGLTTRTANVAVLKTFVFVQVIPWLVIWFGSTLVTGLFMAGFLFRSGAAQPGLMIAFLPLLSAVSGAVLALGKNIGFVIWSRKRLHSSLRTQAGVVLGAGTPPPLPIPGHQEARLARPVSRPYRGSDR